MQLFIQSLSVQVLLRFSSDLPSSTLIKKIATVQQTISIDQTQPLTLTLTAFQTTIAFADIGEYYLDIEVKTRTVPHIVPCLYSAERMPPPTGQAVSSLIDDGTRWSATCDNYQFDPLLQIARSQPTTFSITKPFGSM